MKPWWGELIYFIGNWITAVPILMGLIRIKRLDKKFSAILIWMITMACIQAYSFWQFSTGINNLPSFHLMIFLEVTFAGYFFCSIVNSNILNRLIIISGTSLLLYIVINAFFIQTIFDYCATVRTIESYILMSWSLLYLFNLLKQEEIVDLFNSSEFYIVIAILLYFGTAQFIHLFEMIVARNMPDVRFFFRYILISIMIFYYSLIAIGLWKKR